VRRGSRSRGGPPSAPPPLFEGQTASQRTQAAAKPAAAPAAAPAWFPSDRTAAVAHLAGYKGVGQRTAEALLDAIGAESLYTVLSEQPERVKEVLGPRRGETIVAAFEAERSTASPDAAASKPSQATRAAAKKSSGARTSRGTRKTSAASTSAAKSAGGAASGGRQGDKTDAKKPAAKKSGSRRGRRGGARKTSAPSK
jgi:hypothetical protein